MRQFEPFVKIWQSEEDTHRLNDFGNIEVHVTLSVLSRQITRIFITNIHINVCFVEGLRFGKNENSCAILLYWLQMLTSVYIGSSPWLHLHLAQSFPLLFPE